MTIIPLSGRCDVPGGGTHLERTVPQSAAANHAVPHGHTPCPVSPASPVGPPGCSGVQVFRCFQSSAGSWFREDGALGHQSGGGKSPQRHQELARKCDDCPFPRPPVAGTHIVPVPLRERTLRLVLQPAPGHLDQVLAQHRIAVLADPPGRDRHRRSPRAPEQDPPGSPVPCDCGNPCRRVSVLRSSASLMPIPCSLTRNRRTVGMLRDRTRRFVRSRNDLHPPRDPVAPRPSRREP